MNCPNCQTPIQHGAAFCDNCGTALSQVQSAPAMPAPPPVAGGSIVCPQCQTAAMPGEAFCGNCGASLPASGAAPMPSAPPQPAAQPASYAPAGGAAGSATSCPNCGTPQQSGSAFCDNCGTSLASGGVQQSPQSQQSPQWQPQPPPPPQPPQPQPQQWQQQQAPPQQQQWQQQGPIITPRLVVQATNTPLSFPMGKSELLIGREDPVSGHFPEVNLGPHGGEDGGVSRSHAKLFIQGNQCLLEDLQSVNFTHVNKQRLNPGTRQPLNHGDELRFGKVVVMFYTQ